MVIPDQNAPIRRMMAAAMEASKKGQTTKVVALYSEALASARSATLEPKTRSICHLNRGFALRQLKRPHEALQDYAQALELNPACFEAHVNAGLIYAQDFKQYAKGLAEFDKAFELNPMSADVLSSRGLAKEHLGDIKGAEEDMEAALSIEPENVDCLYNLGMLYLRSQQREKGIKQLRKALTIAPSDKQIKRVLNSALALKPTLSPLAGYFAKPAPRSSYRRRGAFILLLVAVFAALSAIVGIKGLVVYIFSSLLAAVSCKPGLAKHDGPPIDAATLHHVAFGPAPLAERDDAMDQAEMRMMLSGNPFFAAFCIILWAGTGLFFFTGELPMGWKAAILIGAVGGYELAVAWYNLAKFWSRFRS